MGFAAPPDMPRLCFPLGDISNLWPQGAGSFSDMPRNPAARAFYTAVKTSADILSQSPTGRALLRAALLRDIHIGLDPLLEPQSSFYYPLQKRLDLGYQPAALQTSQKGVSQYLASLVGGLRRIWQQGRGMAPDTALRPEDFLRYCRVFEADVTAVTHLTAWELRMAGPCFFWRYLLGSESGDIALCFARAAGSHPRHQFDGTALRAAFLQWFDVPERVDACDHLALETMDMALLAGRGVATGIGRCRLDTGAMMRLGALPQGGQYLGSMRFRSPAMRRITDPFNRTHLQHIRRDILHLSENQKSF